jgi:branched-chain amino acid transport system permease protein
MAQLMLNGLAMGAIYALVALGFILIVNAVGVLNFAQGELLMLGAFIGVTLAVTLGLPAPLAILAMLPIMGLVGYLFQLVAYYPLRDKPLLTVIIATIGVSIALQNLAQVVWGAYPLRLPPLIPTDPVHVGGLMVLPYQLMVLAITFALVIGQHLFFSRTQFGRMMRATAQDREAALLMGIRVRHTIATTFVMSTMLAGLAGMLVGPLFYVSTDMGAMVLLKAFAATIIGGFGSIPGAILGGLFVGVAEILVAGYISSAYKDAVAFAILILVLYLFPQGFFGEQIAERA